MTKRPNERWEEMAWFTDVTACLGSFRLPSQVKVQKHAAPSLPDWNRTVKHAPMTDGVKRGEHPIASLLFFRFNCPDVEN